MSDKVQRGPLSVEQRFWAKVDKRGPEECWPWLKALEKGYGRFTIGYKRIPAHRMSMILAGKEVRGDLTADHLCRNRACVNPAHIEMVPNAVNVLRGTGLSAQNARKTHCKNGHELIGENLRINRAGQRICRPCDRAVRRARYALDAAMGRD